MWSEALLTEEVHLVSWRQESFYTEYKVNTVSIDHMISLHIDHMIRLYWSQSVLNSVKVCVHIETWNLSVASGWFIFIRNPRMRCFSLSYLWFDNDNQQSIHGIHQVTTLCRLHHSFPNPEIQTVTWPPGEPDDQCGETTDQLLQSAHFKHSAHIVHTNRIQIQTPDLIRHNHHCRRLDMEVRLDQTWSDQSNWI